MRKLCRKKPSIAGVSGYSIEDKVLHSKHVKRVCGSKRRKLKRTGNNKGIGRPRWTARDVTHGALHAQTYAEAPDPQDSTEKREGGGRKKKSTTNRLGGISLEGIDAQPVFPKPISMMKRGKRE